MFGRNAGTIGAAGHRRTHHGATGFPHDGADIFKVHVHHRPHIDDLRDTADGISQHIIGVGEGIFLGDVVSHDIHQLVVQHHDEGIDMGFQIRQSGIGIFHAATAFKLEGLGHHADGQNPHFLGDFRHHGRSTRTGSTSQTGGDEQHLCAFDGDANIFLRHFSGFAPFFGFTARTQPRCTQLNVAVGSTEFQNL